VTHLFWAQLMGAALEVATYQRKGNNVTILRREFQTHVELIFKYLAVKADMRTETNSNAITPYKTSHEHANMREMQSMAKDFMRLIMFLLLQILIFLMMYYSFVS
jgi:hypothetical protein